MINGARFPLSCSRSQLRRVRSFLKLQTARVYHDGKGRQRVAQNLVKSAIRTAKKNVIDIYCHVEILWLFRFSNHQSLLFQVGGKHLQSTQSYPGGLGLEVSWFSNPVPQGEI